jgi:sucrose phosphorylase
VRRQIELIRFRNSHPAFAGQVEVQVPSDDSLSITWRHAEDWAQLDVDLSARRSSITCTSPGGTARHTVTPGEPGTGVSDHRSREVRS